MASLVPAETVDRLAGIVEDHVRGSVKRAVLLQRIAAVREELMGATPEPDAPQGGE